MSNLSISRASTGSSVEVLVEEKKVFCLEVQNLFQCVVSDHFRGFRDIQQWDYLKILTSSSPLILQIDKIQTIVHSSSTMAYFHVQAASDNSYSIEVFDGENLNLFSTTREKLKEIDLKTLSIGEKKVMDYFPSCSKGDLLTFELQSKRVHAVVSGAHFGTNKGATTTSKVCVKRFLQGFEIEVDDGRGSSVVMVQEIPMIYSYKD